MPVSDCSESVTVAVDVFFAHGCVIVRANIAFGIGFSFFVGGAKYCDTSVAGFYCCAEVKYCDMFIVRGTAVVRGLMCRRWSW